ncbi:MAG TPA: methylenetetrahydrofolate reductase [NAD(P)H] [Bacillota bacterium]|nr:methylenetetrahydrofolate reductase [NAD(P)H] [Bacillota bacterium]HQQ43984.1 methylenetetrahydrofolate reductase [NAD(P)H] [Bacillota bacterium]
MKIKEFFKNKPVISLEIFPPKPEMPIDTIFNTIDALSGLKPAFMSVTYGAGGSSKAHTVKIADVIKNKYNIEALAHLTCIGAKRDEIDNILKQLKDYNIENIMALRGDIPVGSDPASLENAEYKYAKDLISYIKEKDSFCIGAACYPEGHIECPDKVQDLKHLKLKADSGADFLITQLFFDNNLYYSLLEKLDILDVKLPVSAGIMPVINKRQIERITALCGASIPPKIKRILDKYGDNPEALKEAGIAYATEQIIDLLSGGAAGIHLYTMNRPEVARKIISPMTNIRSFYESSNIPVYS